MGKKKITIDYEQLAALEQSISNWKVRASTGEDDDASCPLCRLGITRNGRNVACDSCPIMEFTGTPSCIKTPFMEFNNTRTKTAGKRAAKKMVTLLKEILSASVAKTDLRYDLEQQKALEESIKLWKEKRKDVFTPRPCPLCALAIKRNSKIPCYRCIIKDKVGGCQKTPYMDWFRCTQMIHSVPIKSRTAKAKKAIACEIAFLESLRPKNIKQKGLKNGRRIVDES